MKNGFLTSTYSDTTEFCRVEAKCWENILGSRHSAASQNFRENKKKIKVLLHESWHHYYATFWRFLHEFSMTQQVKTIKKWNILYKISIICWNHVSQSLFSNWWNSNVLEFFFSLTLQLTHDLTNFSVRPILFVI